MLMSLFLGYEDTKILLINNPAFQDVFGHTAKSAFEIDAPDIENQERGFRKEEGPRSHLRRMLIQSRFQLGSYFLILYLIAKLIFLGT